jgi:hypothetical protein
MEVGGSLYENSNRVATRAWTNANADVPNADHADVAASAETIDILQNGGGLKSGVNNDRAYLAPYDGAGTENNNREISYNPTEGEWNIKGMPKAGGDTIATRSWTNANADVPNADNADYATDAGNASTADALNGPAATADKVKGNDIDTDGDGKVDAAVQADNSDKVDGVNVYIQSSEPTSANSGDVWIQT